MQRPIPRLFAMIFALVAGSDLPTATGPIPTVPTASAVKFWDDNAAVYWNGVANGRLRWKHAWMSTSLPMVGRVTATPMSRQAKPLDVTLPHKS